MTRNWKLFATGLFVCFVAASAMAQQDIRGSQDHPLISRYPASVITKYLVAQYDQYVLPLGKLRGPNLEKSQTLEGKVTRIEYQAPKDRSVLEIYRNYEMALKKAGFETLFACSRQAECGGGSFMFHPSWPSYWRYSDYRHLAAKLARPEGDASVSLHIGQGGDVAVDVIEVKPMEAGLVTVNAEALAGDITRTGHVAVYGIYFDTGKAELKPESDATLKEIAKLLQQDAKLKLYVVGHTDNVGTLASNMDLSKRRAAAVVQALTGKYGVAAARLSAQGDGPTDPVASNDTEEGRAKNRRVELVKQ